jgi:hypothetical protein
MMIMFMALIYRTWYTHFQFGSHSLINRIYSTTHTNSNDYPQSYPLWIIHAVADPGRILIPALAFLLHPQMWKNVRGCGTLSMNALSVYTKFSVPPEGPDISEGITIHPADGGGYGTAVNKNVLF